MVPGKNLQALFKKITKAQVVECLSGNHETLSSNLYSEEKENQYSSTKTEPPRLTQVMHPGEAVVCDQCHATAH
jgi:hypothetical protein